MPAGGNTGIGSSTKNPPALGMLYRIAFHTIAAALLAHAATTIVAGRCSARHLARHRVMCVTPMYAVGSYIALCV
jgi:hypothetical protein